MRFDYLLSTILPPTKVVTFRAKRPGKHVASFTVTGICTYIASLVPRPSQKEGEGSGDYSTISHYGLAGFTNEQKR